LTSTGTKIRRFERNSSTSFLKKTGDGRPETARSSLRKREELSGCRISAIGVGPDRDQTIVVRDLINED